ncbi:MAG: CotH kinase family protein [Anaeroplasmataceae bacterium]|nr:CotH kinase family protein [Anaeroplasmataceae bacterium]
MKKIGLCFLFLLFSLFACVPKNDNQNNNNSNDNNQNNNNNDAPKNIYALGEYGDYVKYVDDSKSTESLEAEYKSLTKKVKGEVNGVFQSEYRQGLLDFFSLDEKIKLSIDISKEELNKLNEDYETGNKESYRICNLDIRMDELLFHYEQVGIRQKGNTSRGAILDDDGNINLRHYKLNFTATFDDEFTKTPMKWTDAKALEYRDNREFFGIEKLNIRWNKNQDTTYLKEYYAFETYRANGLLAPHSNPVQVEMKIDGEVNNLGVYLAVEDIDKSFIKRNVVSASAGGDLYKMGWTNVGATLDNLDDRLFGVEYQVKEHQKFKQVGFVYDLKTNKKTSKHEAIKGFIKKIKETDTKDFASFLETDMIYDNTIKYLAISYLLGDPDDLRGNSNNTYLYFLKDTNQAIFIPTDHDRVLGSMGKDASPIGHHGALSQPFDDTTGYAKNNTAFFNKTILESGNPTIKDDYLKAISSIINNCLNIVTFESYFNKVKQNYSAHLDLGEKVNGKKVEFSLKEDDNIHTNKNLSIAVYFQKKKETFNSFTWNKEEEESYTSYYLRGEMNNWDHLEKKYNLKLENGIPTLVIYLEANQKFKVADSSWTSEFNYEDLVDNTLFDSVGSNKNITAKESGTYKIEIIDYGTDHQALKITKQ